MARLDPGLFLRMRLVFGKQSNFFTIQNFHADMISDLVMKWWVQFADNVVMGGVITCIITKT